MFVGAILKRWVEILAALYLAWRDGQRELRSVIVTCENQNLVVRHAATGTDAMLRDGEAGTLLASVPLEAGVSPELSRVTQNRFVVLEFPADKVVTRQISVPGQARKFLSGVIRNQIERLSPWPANAVVYGFAADAADPEAANVNVRILMASRADIDLAAQDLAGLGLAVDRIVARGSDAEAVGDAAGSITLWSRLADTSPHRLGRAVRAISIGIAASVTICILLSTLALVSAASIQSDSENIAARSRTLQRDMQAGRTASSTASSPPAERAWNLKDLSTSSVVLIEALSRALPDSAYLSEIQLEKERLRITGLADDAPALLAPLQRSGHVTDVHFFAPTTRGPDGKSFRFSIEAHVEPRIKIGED